MAISAPCSWRNSRPEACPRASAPPWCHGKSFVRRCRNANMVIWDRSYLSRHQFAVTMPRLGIYAGLLLLLLGFCIEKVVHHRDDDGHARHERYVCCVGQNG